MWIISGSGLLAYPVILLANVMSLAGNKSKNSGNKKLGFRRLKFLLMLIITTLFPLIYYFCFRFSKDLFESGQFFYAYLSVVPALAISAPILWVFRPRKRKLPMSIK